MKKILAIFAAALIAASFTACAGNSESVSAAPSAAEKSAAKQTTAEPTAAEQTTAEETTAEVTTEPAPAKADVSSWTWTKGELDCYGYNDCYMSYQVPKEFKTSSEDSSGLQSRNYYYNPDDSESNANNSPYGVYINFGQGSFGGATRTSLEGSISGELTEREIGGRKVLFGKHSVDENTGAHVFVYYVPYDEDDYSRIWIILCDPEEDGEFRSTFEQSISFTKQ